MADFFNTYDHAGNVWRDEAGIVWQVFNCEGVVEDIIDQIDVESIYGKRKFAVNDFIYTAIIEEVDDFGRL